MTRKRSRQDSEDQNDTFGDSRVVGRNIQHQEDVNDNHQNVGTDGTTQGATAAAADCAAELESLPGVSKDGTAAPLAESGATPQTGGATAGTDDAADAGKAGNLMPMGEDADVATSAEDAQAQSQGGETAAAQAMGAEGGDAPGRHAAIDEARAALAAGDEAACLAAVEKAKAM